MTPAGNGDREAAVLVGLRRAGEGRWRAEESLAELARLVEAAGGRVGGTVVQERSRPDPRTLIGPGKLLAIREACAAGIDLVVFDDELSGSQQRNLEESLGRRVVDRTALILDIFAQRARTREGQLQVELAQLAYMLPRLAGQWTHLERLGGGIGTRGPGETQLESDRRRIRRRMAKLRADLEKVRRHRAVQRRPRAKVELPTVALVGYTNAGKSSLLNALADAAVPVGDRLFETLDPTVRRIRLPGGRVALLADTVGFIRKLPGQLLEAFKATLEEIELAHLLLHVVDASSDGIEAREAAVLGILDQLGLAARPRITAYNKIDRVPGGRLPAGRLGRDQPAVAVSARTGAGLPELLRAVADGLEAMGAFGRAAPGVRGDRPAAEVAER
jgi:GTP-binding protein HflX